MKFKRIIGIITAIAVISSVSSTIVPQQSFSANAESGSLAKCDFNSDGEITIADAVLLARFIAEDDTLPKNVIESITNGETAFDNDSLLTILEVRNLLQKIAESAQTIPPELTDEDDTLTILCWTGDDVTKLINQFEANHPEYAGHLKYRNVGSSSSEARELYANYFAGGNDVDLYFATQDWILDYINNDQYSMPMAELGFKESDFDQCFPYTLTVGKDSSGTLKAVTWQATPGAYVYRADLAKSLLGAATPEEMQLFVKDWDTFTETAEKIYGLTNGKTAMADSIGGLWQVWKYNISESYIDTDGKAYISDAGKSFADFAKMYYNKGYVTSAEQWSNDWFDIGQNDATLGYFHCTWCLVKGSMLSNSEGGINGLTYGKYMITEGPASWYWGGSWIAASPKCNSRKTAHDFIFDIAVNSETMLQYLNERGDFVNNAKAISQFNTSSGYKNPLLGGQSQYPILLNNARNFDLSSPPQRFDDDLDRLFYRLVQQYAEGKIITIDGLQSTFQREAAKIIQ